MSDSSWSNQSYIAPFTQSGISQMVNQPPWHFAGWSYNVEFEYGSIDSARGLVPSEAGKLNGIGCVSFSFLQWSKTGEEVLDPAVSQFQETALTLQVERPDGQLFNYSPAVWVNQDASILRGLLQGLPKKWGNTSLTMSIPLPGPNLSASRIEAGSKVGASLSVKDRRLLEVRGELTGEIGEPLGFAARPTIGSVAWPDLRNPEELPTPRIIRTNVQNFVGTWYEANATLKVLPHEYEELSLLGEVKSRRANYGVTGYTVTGAIDA
jgi:Acetoacetate decarboxylase (ADC)